MNNYEHPLYGVWNAMKTRCDNPLRPNYSRYGGRGITYDPSWALFENFSADMFPSWKDGLLLDRIDNDLGYSKDNCRWSTPTESSRNRSSNVLTLEKAITIRELYATGNYTQRKLAKMFSTSLGNISHTIHNRQWRVGE